jgi:putative restriction endonuclease
VNLVWDTFGEANGVRSLAEMRERIAHCRRSPIAPNENPTIGCIMLAEPFRCTKVQTPLPEKK